MNEILFSILLFVITVCSILITRVLIPYFKQLIENSKYKKLFTELDNAVRAAEQTIKGTGQGQIKKSQVLDYISYWLAAHNIEISQTQLETLLEAIVFNMNREGK